MLKRHERISKLLAEKLKPYVNNQHIKQTHEEQLENGEKLPGFNCQTKSLA